MARVQLLSCFAAVVCLATCASVEAQNSLGRRSFVPDSSIVRPEDKGLRAHTNFIVSAGVEQAAPSVYLETPASISCIYKLVTPVTNCPIGTTYLTPKGGSGAIAIVDAYDDPNAASDLAVFSSEFGLPSANFSVVYATGSKPAQDPTGQWEFEESLDIEWAHALAPGALIYLVEAASKNSSDLYQAVSVASSLVSAAGGGEVSMSWGGAEYSTETSDDSRFTTSNVLYVGGTGDTAFIKEYPSMSPNVVAAGGTVILRDGSGNFTSEQYWDDSIGGGGGGVSSYESRPSYQSGLSGIVGTHRGVPDISAVASAHYNGAVTGVAIYDSNPYTAAPYNGSAPGWSGVFGTSVATPVLAARLNNGTTYTSSSAFLTQAYSEYANATQYPEFFRDITASNTNCKTGWDICDGIGVPLGYNNAAVSPSQVNYGTFNGLLSCNTTKASTITITNDTAYTLNIGSVSINQSGSAFSDSNGCGSTLAPNGSCSVTVTFHGSSAVQGSNAGTLIVNNSSWASPLSVPLSATMNQNCNGH